MPRWFITTIGFVAASLTTFSFMPQFVKIVRFRRTDGVSLWMMVQLFVGLILWSVYGFMSGDIVIIVANVVGGTIVGLTIIAYLVFRER